MAKRDEVYVNQIKGLLIEHFEVRAKMNNPKVQSYEVSAYHRRILEIETSLTAYERYEVESLKECLANSIDYEKLVDILSKGKNFADRKLQAMMKFKNKPDYTTWFNDFIQELIKLIIMSGRSFNDEIDTDHAITTIIDITTRKEISNERHTSTKF